MVRSWMLFVFVVLAAVGCERPPPPLVELPPPQVRVTRPVARDVTEYVVFTGNAAAIDEVDIRARVSGFVTEVHFIDGQRVSRGEPLFTIDERPYRIARDQAAADVDKQAAELAELEREVARNAPLVQKNVVTREQYEILVAKRDMSKAMLEKARATLAKASLDLEFCTLTSPLDGPDLGPQRQRGRPGHGRRHRQPAADDGREHQAGARLLRGRRAVGAPVAGPGRGRPGRAATANGGCAGRVAKHQGARRFRSTWPSSPTRAFPGGASSTSSTSPPRPTTGTIRCRAELPNADELVLPGMFVRVRLPFGDPEPAVLVPDRAIGIDQGRRYVCVVGPDDRVEHRTVVPGILDGELRVIEKGLSGDERIVVEGLQKAREAAVVRPIEEAAEIPDEPTAETPATDRPRHPPSRRPSRPPSTRYDQARMAQFFIDRPVFATVLSIVILIVGGVAARGDAGGPVSRDRAARRSRSRRSIPGPAPRWWPTPSPRRSSRRSTASRTCSISPPRAPTTARRRSTSPSSSAPTSTRPRCSRRTGWRWRWPSCPRRSSGRG